MKTINLLIFSLFLIQTSYGQIKNSIKVEKKMNYIDSIENVKQIEDLLTKIDTNLRKFKVNSKMKFYDKDCQKISDSLKIEPWTKSDFDNNGLTDILVVGEYYDHAIFCILDKGNGKYEIKRITRRSFQDCSFPLVIENKNYTEINYFFRDEEDSYDDRIQKRKLIMKTLIFKNDDFIEKNKNIINHKITQIEYSTSGCFGTCPSFIITINQNRDITFDAKYYNEINGKEIKGKFKSKVDENKYKEIIDLINYLDFVKLKNNYSVNWTDDQTCTLKINYDNGKVKTIKDYGLIGTFGLNRTYKLLSELRLVQNWE